MPADMSAATAAAMAASGGDGSLRKSANMTECVPVPSSEHVAEIVGRQGTVHNRRFSYSLPVSVSLGFHVIVLLV